MTTALIDGDIICYSAGFSSERKIHKVVDDNDNVLFSSSSKREITDFVKGTDHDVVHIESEVEVDPLGHCLHKVNLMVEEAISATGASNVRVFLTGKGNFREKLATILKYKGNRDKAKRPEHYFAIKDFLRSKWGAEVVDGMEADDQLAIEQVAGRGETVICSADKDLLQVPGAHYNTKSKEHLIVTHEEGERRFYLQAMTGDSTDNILGCPGVGPATAQKYLGTNPDKYWDDVLRLYKDKFGKAKKKLPEGMEVRGDEVTYNHWQTGLPMTATLEEIAIETARLVYMLRRPDEIWTPQQVL